MVEIMFHDQPDMKFEDALSSAMLAKNTLINIYRFSPLKLVTGEQHQLPGAHGVQSTALKEEE